MEVGRNAYLHIFLGEDMDKEHLNHILAMSTRDEAERWLHRHGYGPGLCAPMMAEWDKCQSDVVEEEVETIEEETDFNESDEDEEDDKDPAPIFRF